MTSFDLSSNHSSYAFAARDSLSVQQLAQAAPAVFAEHAATSTGPRYAFISTRDIVSALMEAGFAPTHAVQTQARRTDPGFGRHLLRFRPLMDALSLDDVLTTAAAGGSPQAVPRRSRVPSSLLSDVSSPPNPCVRLYPTDRTGPYRVHARSQVRGAGELGMPWACFLSIA